jgi:prophage maintenance system killer protein
MSNIEQTQSLLKSRADIKTRLDLFPFKGTPEVKEINEKKYLYVRRRVLNKVTSKYVGPYSEELHNLLLRNNEEQKRLNRELRSINKQLALLGYEDKELNPNVVLASEYARANRTAIIYDQAILEGVATTFPDTEAIIERGIMHNVSATDYQKIINLKHAWEFILDKDVLGYKTDFNLISYIAKIVNEEFYPNGGDIRKLNVIIGGTTYVPPIPTSDGVKEDLAKIFSSDKDILNKAVDLCLYIMKQQIFIDGNKRTAVLSTNHYLISNGVGFIAIHYDKVPSFKDMLITYYEGKDEDKIRTFLLNSINKININR